MEREDTPCKKCQSRELLWCLAWNSLGEREGSASGGSSYSVWAVRGPRTESQEAICMHLYFPRHTLIILSETILHCGVADLVWDSHRHSAVWCGALSQMIHWINDWYWWYMYDSTTYSHLLSLMAGYKRRRVESCVRVNNNYWVFPFRSPSWQVSTSDCHHHGFQKSDKGYTVTSVQTWPTIAPWTSLMATHTSCKDECKRLLAQLHNSNFTPYAHATRGLSVWFVDQLVCPFSPPPLFFGVFARLRHVRKWANNSWTRSSTDPILSWARCCVFM